MPQPKIPGYWREKVKGLLSQHDGRISDRAIFQVLRDEARKLWDSPDAEMRALADSFPSQRTIGRIRSDEWVPMSSEEKAQYRLVSWPDTFQRGDLPWEASAATLELLAIWLESDLFQKFVLAQRDDPLGPLDLLMGRPTVRLAEWYWRVTQAAPDLPKDIVDQLLQGVSPEKARPIRYDIAKALATWTAAGASVPHRLRDAIEAYLAYAPWRSPIHAAHYNMAVDLGHIPVLTQEDLRSFDFPLKPYPLEAMRERVGSDTAEYWKAVIEAWESKSDEEKLGYFRAENLRLRAEAQKARDEEGKKEDTDGEAKA